MYGGRWNQALMILPALMQEVQTRMRLLPPSVLALTCWRFGFQRRRVVLWACEMLLPNCGPLPQRSHFCAMVTPIRCLCLGCKERDSLPRLRAVCREDKARRAQTKGSPQ